MWIHPFLKGLSVKAVKTVYMVIVFGVLCAIGNGVISIFPYNSDDGDGHGPDIGGEYERVVAGKRRESYLHWNGFCVIVIVIAAMTKDIHGD